MSSNTNIEVKKDFLQYYNRSPDEIFKEFKVDPHTGLNTNQVKESLLINGPNKLEEVKRSFFKVFIAPIINLLIILYLIMAFIMALLGESQRTTPVFIILGINAVVAIIQQFRAEKQMEALKKLSEATATVIREGVELQISTTEVVLGDIILIRQGDKIPADSRIISSSNLSVNEASLTGESEPVRKNSKDISNSDNNFPIQEQKNMVFLGTFVAIGQCKAVIVRIGANTEIGKISKKLEDSNTGEIPLRKKMNRVAIILGIGVVTLLILSMIYKIAFYQYHGISIDQDTFKKALIDSIDLGLKVMPVNLPLLTTIVLITGVVAMARKGVIVREISRTESLGRVSVVCSDKTGTLTRNEMTVTKIWTPSQEYSVTNRGYQPEGIVHISTDIHQSINKKVYDLLIKSDLLADENINSNIQPELLSTIDYEPDFSILKLLSKIKIQNLDNSGIEKDKIEKDLVYKFIQEEAINIHSNIYKVENSNIIVSKGTPDEILPICSYCSQGGIISKLDDEKLQTIVTKMKKFEEKGFSLLSLAYKDIDKDIPKEKLEEINSRNLLEQDLIFIGFAVINKKPLDKYINLEEKTLKIFQMAKNTETSIENPDLDLFIHSAYLNNNATIKSEEVQTLRDVKTNWTILGLPTEASLIVLGKKYNKNIEDLKQKYEYVFEFNFDSSIKRMSKIFKHNNSNLLFCKGATEWTLPLCNRYFQEGEIKVLNDNMRATILEEMKNYAKEGFRVLTITFKNIEEDISIEALEEKDARKDYEKELIFIGLAVIYDPPREEVFQAIIESNSAGIKTVMITGDSISTGKAIATQLGIFDEKINLAKEGIELEDLSTEDFLKTTVYGRVSPDHKQIIVERYQNLNKVVAMSGDGVNDALALSMADCGLAMGIQGTEVAKEAADMIITDDSFSTIISGIKEGRGLFMKIRVIIYFFILVSVMEAIILFSSIIISNDANFQMWDFGQLQIIYLIGHGIPSLGFTFGTISKTIMNEKPRDSSEILSKNVFLLLLTQMVLMTIGVMLAYYLCYYDIIPSTSSQRGIYGYNAGVYVPTIQIKARTMGMVVLFLLESLIMPLQIRRINGSVLDSLKDIKYHKEFIYYILSIIFLVFFIYSPIAQEFIGKGTGGTINIYLLKLNLSDWIICIGLCLPTLFGFEMIRHYARKKKVVF